MFNWCISNWLFPKLQFKIIMFLSLTFTHISDISTNINICILNQTIETPHAQLLTIQTKKWSLNTMWSTTRKKNIMQKQKTQLLMKTMNCYIFPASQLYSQGNRNKIRGCNKSPLFSLRIKYFYSDITMMRCTFVTWITCPNLEIFQQDKGLHNPKVRKWFYILIRWHLLQ